MKTSLWVMAGLLAGATVHKAGVAPFPEALVWALVGYCLAVASMFLAVRFE